MACRSPASGTLRSMAEQPYQHHDPQQRYQHRRRSLRVLLAADRVTIGNSVTNIGTNAFDSCSSLTNVTMGNGVTNIGTVAFDSCTNLTSITIGNSVTCIGNQAFHACRSEEHTSELQ